MWSLSSKGSHPSCNNPMYWGVLHKKTSNPSSACLLDQAQGWMQLDLQSVQAVAGVVTTGRADGYQWVATGAIQHNGFCLPQNRCSAVLRSVATRPTPLT